MSLVSPELNTSKIITVPDQWKEVFSGFYYTINKTEKAITKKLLPTFQTIMVFNLGAPVKMHSQNGTIAIDKCVLIGPVKKVLEYTLLPQSELLIANFKDDAFYRFFGTNSKLNNFIVDPDVLIGDNCFFKVWSELQQIQDIDERVTILLSFSRQYLKERERSSLNIIESQVDSLPVSPVKLAADKSGQSERTIQLNYKKYLGYSAKEMGRFQRFKAVIDIIQQLPAHAEIDWFEVIHQCGYYDQSHLIHDFNYFLEMSPQQYLKLQQDICIAGS